MTTASEKAHGRQCWKEYVVTVTISSIARCVPKTLHLKCNSVTRDGLVCVKPTHYSLTGPTSLLHMLPIPTSCYFTNALNTHLGIVCKWERICANIQFRGNRKHPHFCRAKLGGMGLGQQGPPSGPRPGPRQPAVPSVSSAPPGTQGTAWMTSRLLLSLSHTLVFP